jgi:hypothetical protein
VLQGFHKGFTRVLQGRYKGVTRLLQVCYKGVTRALQGCYKGVTRALQGCYKVVTRELPRDEAPPQQPGMRPQGGPMVTWVLQGCYKGVISVVEIVECCNGVANVFEGYNKSVTRMLQLPLLLRV